MSFGIVVGLRAEARLAAALGQCAVGIAAGELLVTLGATALVSFGLAGGLDAALTPGALVVPRRVVAQDASYDADPAIAARFGGFTADSLFGADAVAVTAAAKAALFAGTGAVAVDTESGGVARIAAAHGIPFAVVRAVCDPAGRRLPPAALAALDERGAIGLLRVLGAVARAPGQVPDLLRLAADAAAARRTLRRVVRTATG